VSATWPRRLPRCAQPSSAAPAARMGGNPLQNATTVASARTASTTAVQPTAADPDGIYLGGLVFFGIVVFAPLVVGRLIRKRRQREEQLEERTVVLEFEKEEKARVAVADERQRIARELHDVVAHAISVIVVQARGGRRVLDDDPADARAAFDAIERTSTQALSEMRRLLGMLRESDANSRSHRSRRLPGGTFSPSRCVRRGCRSRSRSRASRWSCPPGSTSPPTGSCRKRYERAEARRAGSLEITDDGTGTGDGGGS